MLTLRPIYHLIFEATHKCSLNCRHCYNVQRLSDKYPRELLNTQDTVSLLKTALKKMKPKQLILTGGELYTRPDVNDLILAAEENGIKSIHIMTNGSFLDSDKIAFAKAHKVNLFEISFIS